MIVGVPKETFPQEHRVALTPLLVAHLKKKGLGVTIQSGAGQEAGYLDQDYTEKGATVVPDRESVYRAASVILQVRAGGANPEMAAREMPLLSERHTLVSFLEPLGEPKSMASLAERKVTSFSMEMIPRITRAQSMDALSSMATIAGYKAVLLAANALPKMFPMLMTAAGTVTPAKVLIVGAGVAGLQAIATAKRLGAVVYAYDIRPAVKEQVQSLGAKFVELELSAADAQDQGGYAKAMDEEFYRRQRELMGQVVAECDVVITTAAIPGKKAPILVTTEMVEKMRTGSVVVDLAAERGGNCELTKAGETVQHKGVAILGPVNLPAQIPFHGSQMYAKNIVTLLLHLVKDGEMVLDLDDEITAGTLITRGGEVVHPQVRELLGLAPLTPPANVDQVAAAGNGDAAKE